jgi:hypothetical protein
LKTSVSLFSYASLQKVFANWFGKICCSTIHRPTIRPYYLGKIICSPVSLRLAKQIAPAVSVNHGHFIGF